MPNPTPGTVYIIVLNFNGTADTIDCLKSLQRLTYPHYKIILCDNGSTPESFEELTDWLDSVHQPYAIVGPNLTAPLRSGMAVIKNETNLGYAGGNNTGLRYAMAQPDFQGAWILNNDTTVDPAALTALVDRCQQDSSIGQCGSLISYHQSPDTVQLQAGGRYNSIFGLTRHIGENRSLKDLVLPEKVEQQLDYVSGASLFVTKAFLETVGLMDESLFLFYEELDWNLRNRDQFRLAYAPDSRVLHKVGRASGSTSKASSKSAVADYYGLRNRIIICKRYYPWFLPTVYLGLAFALLKRLVRGQSKRAKLCAQIMISAGSSPPPAF